MIAYFPEIYPDELVYSLLSRFYQQSGYISYVYAAEDIYVYKQVRPDHYFINVLSPEMKKMITKQLSMEQLIEKHTMYPYYARFMKPNRKKKAFESLVNLNGNYSNLLVVPQRKNKEPRYLRYCPICAKQDREQYGETYWHRSHQMIGIEICPIHKCYLVNSSLLISGKESPSLTSAESIICDSEEAIGCNNPMDLRLSSYVLEVFQTSIDIDSDESVGRFLHSKLKGTKYLTESGLFRNLKVLHADYLSFYKDQDRPKMEVIHIQKIFNDYRFNFFEICEIALFLGLSIKELTHMDLSEEPSYLDAIYLKVSRETREDLNRVITIGAAVLKAYESSQRVQLKCGPRIQQWEKKDDELLPIVIKTIEELYGNEETQPHKITLNLIKRTLSLPDIQLDKLPLCKQEIDRYQESQQQYWARKVVWAAKRTLNEGNLLNWRRIRDLTNMRKVNFSACLPYIDKFAEEGIANMIKELI